MLKRHSFIRVTLGAALALLAVAPVCARSLVKNGDFEAATLEPWGEYRWAGNCAVQIDKTFVHSGRQSLRFEASGTGKVGLHQKVGTLAPGWYRLSGYIRAVELQEGQWKRTLLTTVEAGDDKALLSVNPPTGTYGWREFSAPFQVTQPSDSTLWFYIYNTGRVWLDDIRLEPLAQAPEGKPALALAPETGSLAAEIDQSQGVRCPFCHAGKKNEGETCRFCGYQVVRPEVFDTEFYRVDGGNLMPNGGFEEAGQGSQCPFPGWHGRQMLGGEYSFSFAPGHTGRAASITGAKAGRGDIHNLPGFKVKAGSMLRVRFWGRAEGLNGGTFATIENPADDSTWAKINIENSQAWKQYESFVKVPGAPGEADLTSQLWVYNFGTGSLLVDDVTIETVKPDPEGKARAQIARLKGFLTAPLPASTPAKVKAACAAALAKVDEALKQPRLEDLPALRRAVYAALSPVHGGDGSFMVGVANPMEQVFLDEPYSGDFASEMRIALARGESEGAQVVVVSAGKTVQGASVSLAGDLKPAGSGAVLPASQVQLNVVGYVDTTFGNRPYQTKKYGWWPDPLLPNASFNVKPDEAQPVLVTVTTTDQTAPGVYQGTLLIKAGKTTARLPLSVEVLPFTLPAKGHYRSFSLGCGPENVAKYYGGDPDQKIMERFVAFACDRRMPPASILNGWAWGGPKSPKQKDGTYDWSALDRWLDFYRAHGVTRFPMAVVPRYKKFGGGDYNDRFKAGFVEFIKAYAAHLKEKGMFDGAVMYNIDEAANSLGEWDVCKEMYKLVKEAVPDLPVVQCMNEPPGVRALSGSVDIWDLYYGQYEQAGGPARQKAGDQVMLAICIWPSEHPNLFIEYPLLDDRIAPWIGYRVGSVGFEYWEMFSWAENVGKGDWITTGDGTRTAWRLHKPHGDGLLMYPGPNGTPLSSLRLESLRDGLEDYEYLTLLSEGAKRDPAAAALLKEATERLVTGVTSYDPDPKKLLDLRLRIARTLGGGK